MPKLKYKYILNVLQLYFYTDIIMYFGNNKPIKLSVYESEKQKRNSGTFTIELFFIIIATGWVKMIGWIQLLKCEYVLVSLPHDSKLNISVVDKNPDIWGRHLGLGETLIDILVSKQLIN